MRLETSQGRLQVRAVRIALLACSTVLLLSTTRLVFASDEIEAGYRNFQYPNGTGGNSEPTAEKPESKLWWNDGYWWASMWQVGDDAYHIFRLDLENQTWIDTGTELDDRSNSRADTLWDGNKLYVASHIFAQNSGAPAPPGQRGELYRYSYDSDTKTYMLDEDFPVEITGGESETLVLEKATNGQLWVTYVEDRKVMVNHSRNGDDADWAQPFALDFPEAHVGSDDISSIVTYNQHIGVMWSNQDGNDEMYFAVHPAGGHEQNAWSRVLAYDFSGDDHINLKSLEADSEGNVYAAIKSSKSAQLIVLLVCKANGNFCRDESDWEPHTVYDSSEHNPTRPIVLIDTSNRNLYVFTRNVDDGHQAIYYKSSSLDNIQFSADSIGTPFIKSATETRINDPTSTKQNVNGTTGLVVLASDSSARTYFHNYLSLPGTVPQYSLALSSNGSGNISLDPAGGLYDEGTEVTLTATPDDGWVFDSWSGALTGSTNPATIIMDGDKAVTATFSEAPPIQYGLAVTTVGSGGVTLDPPGGLYDEGTAVTVTAKAGAGWTFGSWSGDLMGSENPTTVVMDADKELSATFVQQETRIQIQVSAKPITASIGQVITYTYVVANIGEATLNDVVVVDERLGTVTLDRTTLASGETTMGRLSYRPIVDDLPGPLQNKATVTATSTLDEEVSDSDTISVTLRQLSHVYYMPLGFSNSALPETMQNENQATRSGPDRLAANLAAARRWTARR